MQKIMDYRVKDNNIFIGFEDSKKTWKLCVRSDGYIVHETSLPSEYDNLHMYLRNNYPGCSIKLMYESGFSGFWLHDLLRSDGIDCIVTPANRVTMEKYNAVKTDKRDARRLAKNLENGDYVRCHVPDKERREDRQVSRTLEQVQRKITRAKNQIRRFLDFHGLNHGLPAGGWRSSDYKKLDDIDMGRSLRISFNTYIRELQGLELSKKELIDELKALSKKDRYRDAVQSKQSCPGIGLLTAVRLTLEWGKMDRFPDGKHIASYSGLTCSEYSTGDTVRKGRITAQSSSSVRAWLIQCAWISIRKDPVLFDKFKRVWLNSGSKKKAIVAVSRKIVVRLRAMELTGINYVKGVLE